MKKFDEFFQINESFVIPGVKIGDLFKGLTAAGNNFKKLLASYFNTYEDYIDVEDNHVFKINDLTGDILSNHRVILKVIALEKSELLESVRNNIVELSISEFYSSLPNNVNIYGVNFKPISFINTEELKYTFENLLTEEELVKIITKTSGYLYKGEKDGYYIWSIKA